MIKVLFLIHDLGQGGAEKVLVDLVNSMDTELFDITVISLFCGGVNEEHLKPHIRYKTIWKKVFPANSRLMKLLTPRQLHRLCVKEQYDVEISYLEGPSARIISGCEKEETVLLSWFHSMQFDLRQMARSFRSVREMKDCYGRFHRLIGVSEAVTADAAELLSCEAKCLTLYNTVDSEVIRAAARKAIPEWEGKKRFRLLAVGTLKEIKGFDRLLRIAKDLKEEGYDFELCILGKGPMEEELKSYVKNNGLESRILFPGYQTNPYKYMKKSDLFICSSYSEGFSTAVTEALITGVPVCTVNVSGMQEMLGNNNEYGLIVPNTEEDLKAGIRCFLDDPKLAEHYTEMAARRGQFFEKQETVRRVEALLQELCQEREQK